MPRHIGHTRRQSKAARRKEAKRQRLREARQNAHRAPKPDPLNVRRPGS